MIERAKVPSSDQARSNSDTYLNIQVFTAFLRSSLMRLTRIVMLAAALAGLGACDSDEVTTPTLPPLGQVRFINAVADTIAVDIRAVDQIEYSPVVSDLRFRGGTHHQPIEAKSRKFRVFATSRDINVTSVPLLEATVDVVAGSRVTLLLVGSARNKSTLRFEQISDDVTAPPAGMIAVRVVNAAPGSINGYLVNAATDPIGGTAAASNVAALARSPYVTRATGTAALRVTDAGSVTPTASAAGPVATNEAGKLPAAGVNSEGTKFSVYYFPRGVAGSNNNAMSTPAAVWFVDRNPADQ